MQSDIRKGKQKKEWLDELKRACEQYNVDISRVVYVGALKGEKRTFVAESAGLVRRFFDFYKIPKNTRIL